jgi:hypothetical protein
VQIEVQTANCTGKIVFSPRRGSLDWLLVDWPITKDQKGGVSYLGLLCSFVIDGNDVPNCHWAAKH